MKKVIVSVTNDLTTDQRVAKVCNSLIKHNYSVLLIGRKLKNSNPINRVYPIKRFKLIFNRGFLFYAEYNIRLFLFLLFSKKDILLSNDLDTLIPNFIISKLQRKKLVFDSHELFSEVPELVNKPLRKKFWQQLENYFIPKVKNCYTVCESIAAYYNKNYNTFFKVVRNCPYDKPNIKSSLPINTHEKKIILYQGAINLGRGLELMIDTMNYLDDFIFIIIGNGDILEQLQQKVIKLKLNDKVFFLGKISPEKLHQITPNAYLGISLEEDLGLNYRFALPNKIFDYIQAEVPIITSNLPEMKNIVTNYNIGEIIKVREPKALAFQIQQMNTKLYTKNLKEAKKELVWKNEEQILISIFENLM